MSKATPANVRDYPFADLMHRFSVPACRGARTEGTLGELVEALQRRRTGGRRSTKPGS